MLLRWRFARNAAPPQIGGCTAGRYTTNGRSFGVEAGFSTKLSGVAGVFDKDVMERQGRTADS